MEASYEQGCCRSLNGKAFHRILYFSYHAENFILDMHRWHRVIEVHHIIAATEKEPGNRLENLKGLNRADHATADAKRRRLEGVRISPRPQCRQLLRIKATPSGKAGVETAFDAMGNEPRLCIFGVPMRRSHLAAALRTSVVAAGAAGVNDGRRGGGHSASARSCWQRQHGCWGELQHESKRFKLAPTPGKPSVSVYYDTSSSGDGDREAVYEKRGEVELLSPTELPLTQCKDLKSNLVNAWTDGEKMYKVAPGTWNDEGGSRLTATTERLLVEVSPAANGTVSVDGKTYPMHQLMVDRKPGFQQSVHHKDGTGPASQASKRVQRKGNQ